jgi:hypothetical protein
VTVVALEFCSFRIFSHQQHLDKRTPGEVPALPVGLEWGGYFNPSSSPRPCPPLSPQLSASLNTTTHHPQRHQLRRQSPHCGSLTSVPLGLFCRCHGFVQSALAPSAHSHPPHSLSRERGGTKNQPPAPTSHDHPFTPGTGLRPLLRPIPASHRPAANRSPLFSHRLPPPDANQQP